MLDASGCVVTPGLVNAHHHLLQSAFRTLPGTRGVPMREWLPRMAAAYAAVGVDAELAAAAAAVGLAESLLCGVTTVADHHLTWPSDRGVDGRRSWRRRRSRRRRRRSARGWCSCAARPATTPRPRRRRPMRSRRDWAATPRRHGAARGRAGGGAQRRAGDVRAARRGGAAARAAPAHAGQRAGRRRAWPRERYGRRPLDLLDEWGWLAPDVTLAHLCDVTPGEIARVAAAGVTAPPTRRAATCRWGGGWRRWRRWLDAGVAVGLGTSGGGSQRRRPPAGRRTARDAGRAAGRTRR